MTLMQNEINHWLKSIEKRFELGTPGNCSTTLYGDKFVELVGMKDGKYLLEEHLNRHCTHFKTPREALDALITSFSVYSEGKKNKLFWRILPEINMDDHKDFDSLSETCGEHLAPTDYIGYMRLFIQEKFE
jgi:hypothetical protein